MQNEKYKKCISLIYLIFNATGFLFTTSGILQICYCMFFLLREHFRLLVYMNRLPWLVK